jgi:hypothetical protein
MMAQITTLAKAFITLSRDERVQVKHISIYMALLYLWVQHGNSNQFPITRKQVMKLAHVSSSGTYHKAIKQLQEFGYINYIPSYNHFSGSQVMLLFDSGVFPK